jgi:hypothetical protein
MPIFVIIKSKDTMGINMRDSIPKPSILNVESDLS